SAFTNITPGMILDALPQLIDKLSALGVGDGVFQQKLPLINKSIAELVDLGKSFKDRIGGPGSALDVTSAKKLEKFLNDQIHKLSPDLNVKVVASPGDISFTFTFKDGFQKRVPLSFSVGQGLDLVHVKTGDDQYLDLQGGVEATLALGINTAKD